METFGLHKPAKNSIFLTGDFLVVFIWNSSLESYIFACSNCVGEVMIIIVCIIIIPALSYLWTIRKSMEFFNTLLILLNMKNYHYKLKANGFTHRGKWMYERYWSVSYMDSFELFVFPSYLHYNMKLCYSMYTKIYTIADIHSWKSYWMIYKSLKLLHIYLLNLFNNSLWF